MKHFDTLGVMLDCSRNAVPTLEDLYYFIDCLAAMGYNALQLYTEDVYEIEGEPYFGYQRGRYTKDELKAVDAYCRERGIELQPCIQTLAHLETIFRWPAYAAIQDMKDVLLCENERTYALIDKMFATAAECFTSRRIHIGMDEAHALGRGKYLDEHGAVSHWDILVRHLYRVCEIAAKYGFRPMMWSDMFFRSQNGGEYYKPITVTDEMRATVPENVDLVYWDYYSDDQTRLEGMMASHQSFNESNRTVYAGPAVATTGFFPHNGLSMRVMRAALKACIARGVREAYVTIWNDDGGECPHLSLLPTLYHAAALAKGKTDEDEIKAGFCEAFGEDMDRLLALDLPDTIDETPLKFEQYAKAAFYNDPFYGLFDPCMKDGMNAYYATLSERFAAYAAEGGRFTDIYDMAAKNCAVLALKAESGLKARRAYQSGDRAALAAVAEDMILAADRLREFYEAFRAYWYKIRKPYGFEVQQFRLVGMVERLRECAGRITDYLAGRIPSLPELEGELLPHLSRTRVYPPMYLCWRVMNTPSVITRF